MERAPHTYGIGEMVFALEDMFNDGGVPGYEEEALLAGAGTRGVVVQIGHVEEDESIHLYLVRFEDANLDLGPPIGCLEEELTQDETLAASLKAAATA